MTASTTNNLDPDGYGVTVDGSIADTVDVNGSVTIAGVSAGDRSVSLNGIAPNCAVEGQNPRTVSLAKNATAAVSFPVICTDPPDGRIYFGRSVAGSGKLTVMNPDGSGLLDLVHGLVGLRIDVSPDGDQIAFDLLSPFGGEIDLNVMNKDKSGLRRLLSTLDSYEGHPSWSPDGSRIAYTSGPGNLQIATVNVDGSNATQMTDHPDHWSQWADWSPDGSKILFGRHTVRYSYESDDRIHVMNADGTGVTPLTESAPVCEAAHGFGWPIWHDFYPKWSPDGSQILFLRQFECDADPSNDYEAIFVMNADGSDPVELVRDAAWADWSPDGSRIVYIKEHIFVMNLDGTDQTLIREAAGEELRGIAWGGP